MQSYQGDSPAMIECCALSELFMFKTTKTNIELNQEQKIARLHY